MAFGSCAASGGPFDTYAVAQGLGACLAPEGRIDVHVPGCPPHPDDLYDALEVLRGTRREVGTA
jgi:NADH-quinone oxidoreductase subunit B